LVFVIYLYPLNNELFIKLSRQQIGNVYVLKNCTVYNRKSGQCDRNKVIILGVLIFTFFEFLLWNIRD